MWPSLAGETVGFTDRWAAKEHAGMQKFGEPKASSHRDWGWRFLVFAVIMFPLMAGYAFYKEAPMPLLWKCYNCEALTKRSVDLPPPIAVPPAVEDSSESTSTIPPHQDGSQQQQQQRQQQQQQEEEDNEGDESIEDLPPPPAIQQEANRKPLCSTAYHPHFAEFRTEYTWGEWYQDDKKTSAKCVPVDEDKEDSADFSKVKCIKLSRV